MRFIVDDKPRETLTAAEAKKAEPDGKVYAVSGKVLAPEESARQSRFGCLIGIGVVTVPIWVVFFANLLFADPRIDNSDFRIFMAAAGVIVPLALYVFAIVVLEKVRKKAAADYLEAPPPGTRIGVGEAGFILGDRHFRWDEIAVERLELFTSHTDDDEFLRPHSVLVSTPAGSALISINTVEEGFGIVREIHRRFWPQTLAALDLDLRGRQS